MSDYEIMHRITMPERGDPSRSDAFEEFMRDEYFPAVFKALPHVGQVTALTLLRGVRATHEWQYEPTNTFLLHVSFSGLASGDASVDEETQRKFDSFGAQVERQAYLNVAVWPEEAEA
jgi:hypothetical protein